MVKDKFERLEIVGDRLALHISEKDEYRNNHTRRIGYRNLTYYKCTSKVVRWLNGQGFTAKLDHSKPIYEESRHRVIRRDGLLIRLALNNDGAVFDFSDCADRTLMDALIEVVKELCPSIETCVHTE